MSREDYQKEVDGWKERECQECGLPFPSRANYERMCPICFKADRDYKVLWGDLAFLWAQEELGKARAQVRQARSSANQPSSPLLLDETLIGHLIFLCHPDKHNNNEKATAATQALLAMRQKLRSKKS